MTIATNKQRAITALLAGASNQDAAKTAGVAPATLCRWKHQPEFASELAHGQAALADATQSDLAALREKALSAIGDALDNEEVNIRLRAAALVMPRNGAPITVNANAQANSAAVVMPELSMEDAVAHILAGPRTVMRAIDAGMIPDTPELRGNVLTTGGRHPLHISSASSPVARATKSTSRTTIVMPPPWLCTFEAQ